MTSTIAVIGKSGSGKTTVIRALLKLLQRNFKDKTILLLDNDLTLELSDSFGIKTRNTIYGIKSGKHEYKTGIPEGMTKQEYIDWALEDIVLNIDENTDIIASWFVTPKDCHCPSTKLTRDSVTKLIERYDFVIIDCEYDLKYLNSLTDCLIDEALIISNPNKEAICLASKIADSSRKYVSNGQMGVIINKFEGDNEPLDLLNALELDLIGCIKKYDILDLNEISNTLEILYSRMNLPQKG
ncbi:MAG: AAA family ATPase [Candidatus Gastranaerophilales bacterium]|nr:AAA family ATPase [Candidatus Gastranaerophilales bacterium]